MKRCGHAKISSLILAAFAIIAVATTGFAQANGSEFRRLDLAKQVSILIPHNWSIVINAETATVDELRSRGIALYNETDDPRSVRALLIAFSK